MTVIAVEENDTNNAGGNSSCLISMESIATSQVTHKRPNERIPISMSFWFHFIWSSYTIQEGSIKERTSVKIETEAVPVTKSAKFIHFALGYAVKSQL